MNSALLRLGLSIFSIGLFLLASCSDKPEKDSIQLIKEKVNSIIPSNVKLLSIEETDVKNFFELRFEGMDSLYALDNGNYLFSGDIYQIKDGTLINKSLARKDNQRKLAILNLDESEYISFSKEDPKYVVYVFTDVNCVYCRKFHSQIEEYTSLGIRVNYLAFPREGVGSDAYDKMVTAWCSEDKKNSLTELKLGLQLKVNLCNNNPVTRHFNLGNTLGIKGTPSIITSQGVLIPGYVTPMELLTSLEN